MSYGYVHIRPQPEPPTQPAVGFFDYASVGERDFGFTAPDCGGADTEFVYAMIYANSTSPCSVRVRTIDASYVAGVDYIGVDQIIELPGTDPGEGEIPDTFGFELVVTINNPAARCDNNPAFLIELSEPVNCTLGGTLIVGENSYALVGNARAIALGV